MCPLDINKRISIIIVSCSYYFVYDLHTLDALLHQLRGVRVREIETERYVRNQNWESGILPYSFSYPRSFSAPHVISSLFHLNLQSNPQRISYEEESIAR